MSDPIVEIDKLVRLVIDESVEVSPRTAVAFALTCLSLEKPAPSSILENQYSLDDLVRVLYNHTRIEDDHGIELIVSDRDLPVNQARYQYTLPGG